MRRASRRAKEHTDDSHGIDLAPMLDFVLNLLIFFIITAVFVKESGLVMGRPNGEVHGKGDDASGMSIRIAASGEVVFEDRAIDVRAIRANVERVHAIAPEKGALVIAAPDAPMGAVVQAVDAIRLAGVENVTFATGR